MLDALGVPHEVRVVSAHRTPDLLFEYAVDRARRGLEVIIAGAGGAAHLPGMMRRQDLAAGARRAGAVEGAERPRLAALDRADAGRHPGRHARDRRGRRDQRRAARRRRSSATRHPAIRAALDAFRAAQTDKVLAQPDPREPTVAT